MPNDQLIHDVAWATSQHIVEVFAPCLREEEQPDAFAEVYARLKACLETFEIESNRREQRLHPSQN